MKKDKTLLFTFDYELFLGKRSGDVIESVITPTEEVLVILDEFNCKSIFFIDTTWLIKLTELSKLHPACANKLNLISSQILNIVAKGHDVFPHLHPHWMDAIYNPNTDEFNLENISRYRINQISSEERTTLFDASIMILNNIIHKDFPNYKIDGFRAGGWSIQPFSNFEPSFMKHGIKYDFSVMPLVYQFTEAQQFDFSNCPNKNIYCFTNKVSEEEINGSYLELTSNIIYIERWRKLLDKFHQKILFRILKDSTHLKGIGVHAKSTNKSAKSLFGIDLSNSNYERVSLDHLSYFKLSNYKKFIEQQSFIQFVSHPKIINKHNIKMLKCLLKFADANYTIKSDFRYFSNQNTKTSQTLSASNCHSQNVTASEGSSTEKMNTISVVIPCYNVADYISDAIQSVINQTLPCIEIICVDDCSSDETVSKIKSIQQQHPHLIKLVVNEKNEGANYSRNKGLKMATGEFVQFFDADDLLLPNKFEYQLNLIHQSPTKIDLLVSGFKKRNLAGVDTLFQFDTDDVWNSLMKGRLGVTTANLFRRSALINAGGWNDNLKSSQEYDLMFRMLKNGSNIKIDNEVMNINRERPSGSITKSNPEAKWIRFINLRIEIFNYLKEKNQLSDKIKNTFINEVFNSIRIIYYYNKNEAIDLHRKFILPIGKPTPTPSNSKKYLFMYNNFGFEFAQKIATLLHPNKPL